MRFIIGRQLRALATQLLQAGTDHGKIISSARARRSGEHCWHTRQTGALQIDWKIMVNKASCVRASLIGSGEQPAETRMAGADRPAEHRGVGTMAIQRQTGKCKPTISALAGALHGRGVSTVLHEATRRPANRRCRRRRRWRWTGRRRRGPAVVESPRRTVAPLDRVVAMTLPNRRTRGRTGPADSFVELLAFQINSAPQSIRTTERPEARG